MTPCNKRLPWSRLRICALSWLSMVLTAPWAQVYADGKPVGELKQVVVAGQGHECPIQLVDPYGARVRPTRYVLYKDIPDSKGKIRTVNLFLQLSCQSSNDADRPGSVPARFDQTRMKWIEELSQMDPLLRPYTKTFPLNGLNSLGIGVTWVMTPPGSDGIYPVHFIFCLRHPPVMLCGDSSEIADLDDPRSTHYQNNVLPIALKVIRSIQFVDTPSAPPATVSPASSSSASGKANR